MKKYLTLSVVALLIAGALDFVWIGFVAKNFYLAEYGALYTQHVVVWAAALFYIIYSLGITYFVVLPALRSKSATKAIFTGGFFALVAFGTYDLTSLAVTANWPVLLSIVDMTWGVVQGVLISLVTYWIGKALFRS
jgi:uncharacterized membrane protein